MSAIGCKTEVFAEVFFNNLFVVAATDGLYNNSNAENVHDTLLTKAVLPNLIRLNFLHLLHPSH
jgi:hypothetical protein